MDTDFNPKLIHGPHFTKTIFLVLTVYCGVQVLQSKEGDGHPTANMLL